MPKTGIHAIDAVQTALHLLLMLLVLAGTGWLVLGPDGALVAALVPLGLLVWLPRVSPHFLMRLKGAVALAPWDAPDLHRRVAALAARAGLDDVPDLYLHPGAAINAFAAGDRDHAAIALSRAALTHLSPRELDAVLAHEVAHLAAGDLRLTLFAELVRSVTSAVALLGLVLCVVVGLSAEPGLPVWLPLAFAVAPTVIGVVQMALSRRREFAADAEAARLTDDPMAMASALDRIQQQERSLWARLFGAAVPALEAPWLRSHPPTGERIRRLLGDAALRERYRPRPRVIRVAPTPWRMF